MFEKRQSDRVDDWILKKRVVILSERVVIRLYVCSFGVYPDRRWSRSGSNLAVPLPSSRVSSIHELHNHDEGLSNLPKDV
jgi:hypothetical protein